MKCLICKRGETAPEKAKVALRRGEAIMVIKDVPADICQNCGEYYLSEVVTERVLTHAETAVREGVEFPVLMFDT